VVVLVVAASSSSSSSSSSSGATLPQVFIQPRYGGDGTPPFGHSRMAILGFSME